MTNVFSGDSKDAKKGRKWLVGLLEKSIVEVTFTKKNGTERIMKCTLQEDYLPETVGSERKKNEDALAVFDLDMEDWRSFRWDSIKQVNFSISENANTRLPGYMDSTQFFGQDFESMAPGFDFIFGRRKRGRL